MPIKLHKLLVSLVSKKTQTELDQLLSQFEEFPKEKPPPGFLISADNENSNESRSAYIKFVKQNHSPKGSFIFGEKAGRLSAVLMDKEFRSVIFHFPLTENPEEVQRQEQYRSDKNLFLKFISERILVLIDLKGQIHTGPAAVRFSKN